MQLARNSADTAEAAERDLKAAFDELEKIKLYKESSLRKEPTLNREKYFAELDKLNANKEETDKLEEMVNGDSGVKRDYYLDETLRITTDYFDQINLQNAL